MENEFLIVQVYHSQNTRIGDFLYRIEQPAVTMGTIPGVKVVNLSIYSPFLREFCVSADLLILHLVSDQDVLPILEERKRKGLPNVFEISDNMVAFQPHDPMREYFNDPANLATTFLYANLADAVQVTSEELANRFDFLNDSFVVFENQIEAVSNWRREKGDTLTVGWGGSLSHLEDLKWLAPTVVKLCNEHENVHFTYMGSKNGFELFREIPGRQKTFVAPGSLHDYYRFLDSIDVGLAPLMDTEYNRCRSDIKFVEYASRGVVPVLAALPPYTKNATPEKTALLFSDEKELFDLLSTMLKSPDLRMKVARNAHEYARTNRQEHLHVETRVEFYKGLCHKNYPKNYRVDVLKPLASNSDSYTVEETLAEKFLSKGFELFSRGDVLGEWKTYREAIETNPAYHVPHFALGDSLFRHGEKDKAIQYFSSASELCPHSLRTKLLLGLCMLEKDKRQACYYFKDAISLSPRYAPAWNALGMVQNEVGLYARATEFFSTALEANPFYSPAVLNLGRSYLAMGKVEDALQALRIADDILPNHVQSRLLLAQLFFNSGMPQNATKQCIRVLQEDPRNQTAHSLLAEISSLSSPCRSQLVGQSCREDYSA